MVQKAFTTTPRADQSVGGSLWAVGERSPLFLHIWESAHCLRGPSERPTVGLYGMKPGLDSSSLLCCLGRYSEGAGWGWWWGSNKADLLVEEQLEGAWGDWCSVLDSYTPACIVSLNVTTAFSRGNQLWDLEFEQWWWARVCFSQSICLLFLNF